MSNQLQQWTNFCTKFSLKTGGVGDASPLSKKVGGRRPRPTTPLLASRGRMQLIVASLSRDQVTNNMARNSHDDSWVLPRSNAAVCRSRRAGRSRFRTPSPRQSPRIRRATTTATPVTRYDTIRDASLTCAQQLNLTHGTKKVGKKETAK